MKGRILVVEDDGAMRDLLEQGLSRRDYGVRSSKTAADALNEVLDADYVRTAHAKGQWPRRILFTHALKNAAVPIVTTIGVGLTLLISGVVVTESVFALPGLGRLTADAVLQRDYSIIQGVTLLSSAVYVLVNLLVDLCYLLLDPRIRY